MKIEFDATADTGPQVAAPATLAAAAPPPLRFDLRRTVLRQLVVVSLGYLVVMGLAFREGAGIGLIFAIFGFVGIAYYGLPYVMARASGATPDAFPPQGAWGIDTASGYLPGHAAWAQIMTVPLLMLAWAVVVAFLR